MSTIQRLSALEILDSRGRPTVQAACELASGAIGVASIPAGASTGSAEALELRDGDPARYHGLGCRRAVQHINEVVNTALTKCKFDQQSELDRALIELDGTANKARLGANAILAVSIAFARATALERRQPLYHYFASVVERTPGMLPRPTINLFSGGKHAGGQISIQDVLIVPVAAGSMDEALAMTYAVYQSAAQLVLRRYGMRALTADEGGLAPNFASAEAMLADAVEAIQLAGYAPGRDVALAVDVAASHFFDNGVYQIDGRSLDSAALIEHLLSWLRTYPIISLEDGLAEDDWTHWPTLCARVDGQALVLGDDLLCTNPRRIQRAVETHAATALLLKVNQIGTVTEAAEANALARAAGWHITISARSGETEDNWLADLAVGWGGQHIKIGSITHSERLAKYNRLLAIEAETGWSII